MLLQTRNVFIAAGIAAALLTAAGTGPAAAAQNEGKGSGAPLVEPAAKEKVTYGKKQILQLTAVDFAPVGTGADYKYCGDGGVCATAGSEYFNTGLRLPAGTRILKVIVYVNPNGSPVDVSFTSYKPTVPTYQIIKEASSTAGTAVEAVPIKVGHVLRKGWNYRVDNIRLSAGQATLYGAKVVYRERETN
ncbi:hypothetical protein [Microbaculum sp. FT89]|uniref:hypothetical protein n=1 Tax=Microbaculum sp. FT89 TaxID=3447298 RepID=UPI003F53E258